MRRLVKIALWIAVLYVVVIGLQACATSKAHRAKFDGERYNLEKRHKRWP